MTLPDVVQLMVGRRAILLVLEVFVPDRVNDGLAFRDCTCRAWGVYGSLRNAVSDVQVRIRRKALLTALKARNDLIS